MKRLLGYDREKCRRRTDELMQAVNLRQEFLDRYPHEFSGGQAQRIGVARALAAEARVLILDEPVSALDVSVQAQVLNLLDELKTRFNLTYVFISHDLSVVESVSDRVVVMYLGRIVETAPAAQLFRNARHPYTRLLLDSAPVPGRLSTPVSDQSSELPDPLAPPPGCAFAPRCRYSRENCRHEVPGLDPQSGSEHRVSCLYPLA